MNRNLGFGIVIFACISSGCSPDALDRLTQLGTDDEAIDGPSLDAMSNIRIIKDWPDLSSTASLPLETGRALSVVPAPHINAEEYACGGDILGWAKTSEVDGASKAVSNWEKSWNSGQLFSCRWGACSTIVKTKTNKNDHSGYAICKVEQVGKNFGAPKKCSEIYIQNRHEEYIRIISRPSNVACMVGLPDFDLVVAAPVGGQFESLDPFKDALEASPLDLDVDNNDRTVLGNASYRSSSVLDGFREMVTVRIDVGDTYETIPDVRIKGATVSTTILVNRQNTTQRTDWTLPSEAQEKHYISTIEKTLKDTLENACADPHWQSSKVLRCDLTDDVEISSRLGGRF